MAAPRVSLTYDEFLVDFGFYFSYVRWCKDHGLEETWAGYNDWMETEEPKKPWVTATIDRAIKWGRQNLAPDDPKVIEWMTGDF